MYGISKFKKNAFSGLTPPLHQNSARGASELLHLPWIINSRINERAAAAQKIVQTAKSIFEQHWWQQSWERKFRIYKNNLKVRPSSHHFVFGLFVTLTIVIE